MYHNKNELNQNELGSLNFVITGKRGYGKTTKAKEIIKRIKSEKTKALVVLDPLNEYSGDFIFTDLDMFLAYMYDDGIEKGKSYVAKFRRKHELDEIITVLSSMHDFFLVIEEANILTSPNYIQDDFSDIVSMGRHFNANYMAICRRPAEISRLLTSQAHVIISFRQTELRDIKNLEERGFDATNLTTLDVGDYIVKSDYDNFTI